MDQQKLMIHIENKIRVYEGMISHGPSMSETDKAEYRGKALSLYELQQNILNYEI